MNEFKWKSFELVFSFLIYLIYNLIVIDIPFLSLYYFNLSFLIGSSIYLSFSLGLTSWGLENIKTTTKLASFLPIWPLVLRSMRFETVPMNYVVACHFHQTILFLIISWMVVCGANHTLSSPRSSLILFYNFSSVVKRDIIHL
jgi:hypothetical protein